MVSDPACTLSFTELRGRAYWHWLSIHASNQYAQLVRMSNDNGDKSFSKLYLFLHIRSIAWTAKWRRAHARPCALAARSSPACLSESISSPCHSYEQDRARVSVSIQGQAGRQRPRRLQPASRSQSGEQLASHYFFALQHPTGPRQSCCTLHAVPIGDCSPHVVLLLK